MHDHMHTKGEASDSKRHTQRCVVDHRAHSCLALPHSNCNTPTQVQLRALSWGVCPPSCSQSASTQSQQAAPVAYTDGVHMLQTTSSALR